ncbi:MAG: hypothetical protein F6K48_11290, partial [Okeania sp. SIO3H1]|nr:hypothetical protein [Okeania sp. SIO3H1]
MLLPAVLHPDIVEFLRKDAESNLQKKVWECIKKLKQQKFDGGLRVKKLVYCGDSETAQIRILNIPSEIQEAPAELQAQLEQ